MPIYEFACPDCRTVFQFFGKASERGKRPSCPRCGRRRLARVPSTFAVTRGGGGEGGPGDGPGGPEGMDDLSPADQVRMEREMGKLMAQAEGLDENNPKELGAFMRRMADVGGVPRDAAMEEAIRRLESGEDPERIEEELGDALEGGEGAGPGGGAYGRDENIYDL